MVLLTVPASNLFIGCAGLGGLSGFLSGCGWVGVLFVVDCWVVFFFLFFFFLCFVWVILLVICLFVVGVVFFGGGVWLLVWVCCYLFSFLLVFLCGFFNFFYGTLEGRKEMFDLTTHSPLFFMVI